MANSLVLPIVMWGAQPPTHKIVAVCVTINHKMIVTGCHDGQLLVWDCCDTSIMPRFMLIGHTSAIVSLSAVIKEDGMKKQHVVSASDGGELCLWDLVDGHCVEQTYLPGTPKEICFYTIQLGNTKQNCILCFGQFSEILILHATTLNVLLTLASRIFPDWMASAVIMSFSRISSASNVLGLTVSGIFKVWHVHKSCSQTVLYEEESKQINCPTAISMKLSSANCNLLIVCTKMWLICDSEDYSVLCSERVEGDQQLLGGDFLRSDLVVMWDRSGKISFHKLPFSGSNQESFRSSLQNQLQANLQPERVKTVNVVNQQEFLLPPAITICKHDNASCRLVLGTYSGTITCSNIDENGLTKSLHSSLHDLWGSVERRPVGIIDQLNHGQKATVTASLYIAQYCFLCCGREDGSIVIVPAAKACRSHLCDETSNKKTNVVHKTLRSHTDTVTCLLYPYQEAPERYPPQLLVSGGADFSVIMWDIFAGSVIYSFHIHGGSLTQLLVPPDGCNPRISQSICSVAQDHSVALLHVRDRKCLVLASRHPSPILSIRWRPADDFMLVSCADSSVYVWQMETGHLDRFERGAVAASIISACDEDSTKASTTLQNTINISQVFKAKSLTLFKAVAQQGLRSLIEGAETPKQNVATCERSSEDLYKAMIISAFRANHAQDSDSHVIFINTEALISRLLMEHSFKSKSTKYPDTQSDSSPGGKRKVFSNLVKPARTQFLDESDFSNHEATVGKPKHGRAQSLDQDTALDIAQIVVSCLHAWGVDNSIDELCKDKLGLLVPRSPVCFGVLSQHGHMALQLPTFAPQPPNLVNLSHWQVSSSLTTQHLVSIISIANTMMTLPLASFLRSLKYKRLHAGITDSDELTEDQSNQQSLIKQSWSLLATLHCVLLPEKMEQHLYKPPRLEMLARRWQDRCLELREAAQALMLAELRQMGASGRRKVVQTWAQHVPDYIYQSVEAAPLESPASHVAPDDVGDRSSPTSDELVATYPSATKLPHEVRRRHATAIVILGVIGAEFGQELDPCGPQRNEVPDGFRISDYSLARHTCKALVYLLLQPHSTKLPNHVPLRRAAIDLLGRGFTVWEPYMEVSAVLLGLLELCESYTKHIGNIQSGYPLSPEADSCRSAHHSLSLIATARPLTFVTTIAREVARYNAAAVNPQHQSLLATSVLVRAKREVLRIIELLADKMMSDLNSVLVEVVDIVLFCIDVSVLRSSYGLLEAVPALAKFHTISYDARSRRVAVSGGHGSIVLYDMRSCKHQVIPRGPGRITALCFSPDGRYLCVYCASENQLSFWATATTLFGMIQSQVKCTKTLNPLKVRNMTESPHSKMSHTKLVWINNRSVVLLTPDGSEHRFHV